MSPDIIAAKEKIKKAQDALTNPETFRPEIEGIAKRQSEYFNAPALLDQELTDKSGGDIIRYMRMLGAEQGRRGQALGTDQGIYDAKRQGYQNMLSMAEGDYNRGMTEWSARQSRGGSAANAQASAIDNSNALVESYKQAADNLYQQKYYDPTSKKWAPGYEPGSTNYQRFIIEHVTGQIEAARGKLSSNYDGSTLQKYFDEMRYQRDNPAGAAYLKPQQQTPQAPVAPSQDTGGFSINPLTNYRRMFGKK